jgi:glycerophosphoryl diester phosphodiesterase
MRLNNIKWQRLRWVALFMGVLAVSLLVFASNRFLYLSHQRFPVLAVLQWNHKPTSEVPGNRPVIVGHRGSGRRSTNPDATPENKLIGNTRKSIQTAIEANVDWIELDIRVSMDGELVVFHDDTIDAKTTGKGTVKSKDFQDLNSYDVLVDPPEKILSLKEVFAEFHTEQRHWVLDIKANGISDDVVSRLEETAIPKELVIIFGDHDVLKAYQNKGYRLGYTTLFKKHRDMLFSLSEVFRRCKDNSYNLLVVPVVFVTSKLVARARGKDIEVWSYDSNDPRDLKYCAECGVKGLIVDAPKAAMSEINNWSERH